jgi:hypothetical protein
MLVRFYSIEWQEESEDLPSTVTLELEDDVDDNEIEMTGGDMLEEEFGIPVDSFEWERVEEEDKDDPFSFGEEE